MQRPPIIDQLSGHAYSNCDTTCENPFCNICEGGLKLCLSCGQAEGELERYCPNKNDGKLQCTFVVDEDGLMATQKSCVDCGKKIPLDRLKIVPGITQCVKCANIKQRDLVPLDPDEICARSSETARNGFGKSD